MTNKLDIIVFYEYTVGLITLIGLRSTLLVFYRVFIKNSRLESCCL